MKRILALIAFICGISIAALGQQSGYGGDGKAASGASVSSFIRLYETAPGAATTALAGAGAGNVDNGAHLVKVTCYTPGGQTTGGTVSNSTTVADKTVNGKIALTGIPTCSPLATGRKVYMTAAGGSSYFLLSNGTIADNTTTTLTANDADATLTASTALPTTNTALDTRFTIGQSALTLAVPFTGNIGFGATTPLAKVDIRYNVTPNSPNPGTNTYGSIHLVPATNTAGDVMGITFGAADTTIHTNAQAAIYAYTSGAYGTRLLFGTTDDFATGPKPRLWIMETGKMGVNTVSTTIAARLHVLDTTEQLRLAYDASNYSQFTIGSGGNMAVNPTGGSFALGPLTPATIIGAAPTHAQGISILQGEELLTIAAAATTDTAMTIPANAVVLSVSVRVTTVIPTAATFTVIGTSSSTVFNTANVSTAATSTDPGTKAGAYFNGTAQTIRITPNLTPADNTGRVRVTVTYYVVTPPTS